MTQAGDCQGFKYKAVEEDDIPGMEYWYYFKTLR